MNRSFWCVLKGMEKLVCNAKNYPMRKGEVVLLPAAVGEWNFRPYDEINLLQIAIPCNIIPKRS